MTDLSFRDGRCTTPEGDAFEAKAYTTGVPSSLWESYSAFANTNGGTIVLGLSEDGGEGFLATGVPNAASIRDDMWSTLNNPQKVSVNVLRGCDLRVETVDGVDLIVMDVPAADRTVRPVYIGSVNSGTYKRNGTGDYHCNAAEIAAMYRDASPESRDMQASTSALIEDLDRDSVEGFRNMMASVTPNSEWLKQPTTEFLRLIGAARRDGDRIVPTLAGLIMFGTDDTISLEVPGFCLDYREYGRGGDEWTLRMVSGAPNWTGNMFDFYTFVTNRIVLMAGTGFSVPDGMNREDDTPLIRALREVATNALVHADHWGRGGVVMEMRPEGFTARNPGTFRIPLDEAVEGGISDPRNRNLAKMLSLVGRAERAGSGVRSVLRTCRDLGLEPPVIRESRRPDAVTVSVSTRPVRGDGIEARIARIVARDSKATMDAMAAEIGVPRSSIVSAVSRMKEDGRLERVGGPRGRWVLPDRF